MKKSTLFFIIFELTFAALFVLVCYYSSGLDYLTRHESAHQEIFEEYNITSDIVLHKIKLYGYTIPTNNETCNADCLMTHNLNEVVGYHSVAIMQTMWFIWLATLFVVIAFIVIKLLLTEDEFT